jgi:2-polyprenyl-3-methyl-5-hydroxy-6-metoxy-1,4-benzoquinol methylase
MVFFAEVAFGKLDAGIDPDVKALKEAKERNLYKEIKPYDGKKIPYPAGTFYTVVCNSTFEHISNIDEVLSETARVLKKDGVLYFTTVTDIWPEYLFGSLFLGKVYKNFFVKKAKHYNMYSIKQWEKKLKKLGLEVTVYQHYLDNKKILWLFDMSHYVSVPSLLTKRFFNKWVLFPQKEKYLSGLETFIIRETAANTKKGPYLFIAARKK